MEIWNFVLTKLCLIGRENDYFYAASNVNKRIFWQHNDVASDVENLRIFRQHNHAASDVKIDDFFRQKKSCCIGRENFHTWFSKNILECSPISISIFHFFQPKVSYKKFSMFPCPFVWILKLLTNFQFSISIFQKFELFDEFPSQTENGKKKL